MKHQIAICCITYNRIKSLKRLLSSLSNSYYENKVTLIISIDKSDTDEVELFADSYEWKYGEKRVIKHQENLGLRNHILSCGEFLEEFDALVVLEDDITVSPSFYQYSIQCVEKYWDDDVIAGISLYGCPVNIHNFFPFFPLKTNSDVYLMQLAQSWGQVWMRRQWKDFVVWYHSKEATFSDTKHLPRTICYWGDKSWLKYHIKYCIERHKYFVYPYYSLSTNNSEAGTHNKFINTVFQTSMLLDVQKFFNINPQVKYDVFFENELLYETLHIDKNDLCIDLYGNKGNRENKRFWLSTRKLNYRIVKSYGIQLKPFEVNVINNTPGEDIILYDTYEGRKGFNLGKIGIVNYLYNYMNLKSLVRQILKYIVNYKYV